MNKFVRTASMRRLLATIAGLVAVIAGGTAIALAAGGSGPVPKQRPLAVAIRNALAAKPVRGISAHINFTDGLIDTSEIQGSDPLLTGGNGRIYISNDGRLRVELFGDNGDPEIVVTHRSWWIYDPTLNTVYEGKLPAWGVGSRSHKASREALPTVAQIQADLNRLMVHLHVSRAIPSDVAGHPTYTVKVSPRQSRGLLGQVLLAWDAVKGVPLRFAVYARGGGKPVLEVVASDVKYEAINAGVFNIKPPRGTHVVKLATPVAGGASGATKASGKHHRQPAEVSGVRAVAKHLSFKLVAPAELAGMRRQSVSLIGMGRRAGALITYGQGLGGIAVIEQPATPNSSQKLNLSAGSGDHANGIALPTVQINGATGQELDTALGTILRFTSGKVTFTVIGSVLPATARGAARAL